MFLLYDLIFLIYTLIYLPYLLLTKRYHKDFSQRLGFIPKDTKQRIQGSKNIWIHAVSVGEVLAIEGLIQQLKAKCPQYQMIMTVTTKTGYELAQKRLSNDAIIIGSPLDFSWVVKGFVNLIKPVIYIAAETEIWPNLFSRLDANQVPVVIINGRLSDKSFPRYQRIKFILKDILSHVRLFCMQSELDAKRIIALGADGARVHVMGNIKFDNAASPGSSTETFEGDKKVWICGSTHPGEEEIILDVYKKIQKDYPQWQLVIAPRHVERAGEVVKVIEKKGFKGVKFSEGNVFNQKDSIVVVDSIGHLRSLYGLASLVFVGKSLRGGGGQNIIEPAIFSKPIIVGPKMENFRDIVAAFKADDAIVQVKGEAEFEEAVKDLMGNEAMRLRIGAHARAVIDKNQGTTTRTINKVMDFI